MKFMMMVLPPGYENAMPGTMPAPEAVAMMDTYNRELHEAGVLVSMYGLHPPSMGARVTFPGGKPKVQDGPFSEAKEVLGGFWMIEVPSLRDAIEWARKVPCVEDFTIEVRPVQEPEDFPEDVYGVNLTYNEVNASDKQR
jgi:hypothetical protein